MIEIQNLRKRYNYTEKLHGITLNIEQGEIIALLGRNGAGKTSFMKILAGLTCNSEGKVLLDGQPISLKNADRIAFGTCEGSFFPTLTPKEHKQFYQMQYEKFREPRFEMLMDFFHIPLNEKLHTFSSGQKAQFETILALCQGADYIFLDEPFATSDLFVREDFYKLFLGILEPNETLMLSTHLIDDIKNFVGRVILLDEGKLIQDILTNELDETATDLTSWLKEQYNLDNTRVINAIKNYKTD